MAASPVAHPSGLALPGAGLLLPASRCTPRRADASSPQHPSVITLAKPINRWFVLVRPVGVPWHKRQTKGFLTETQAKWYAKATSRLVR